MIRMESKDGGASLSILLVLIIVFSLCIFSSSIFITNSKFLKENKELQLSDSTTEKAIGYFLVNAYYAIDDYYMRYSRKDLEYQLFEFMGTDRRGISTPFYKDLLSGKYFKSFVYETAMLEDRPEYSFDEFFMDLDLPSGSTLEERRIALQDKQVREGYIETCYAIVFKRRHSPAIRFKLRVYNPYIKLGLTEKRELTPEEIKSLIVVLNYN